MNKKDTAEKYANLTAEFFASNSHITQEQFNFIIGAAVAKDTNAHYEEIKAKHKDVQRHFRELLSNNPQYLDIVISGLTTLLRAPFDEDAAQDAIRGPFMSGLMLGWQLGNHYPDQKRDSDGRLRSSLNHAKSVDKDTAYDLKFT